MHTLRRSVCNAPRGIAWDAAADAIHVACWGGELVTLPAAGGDAIRRVMLERDLRDAVVANGVLYVTKLKSAELLRLDTTGAIAQRKTPPPAPFGKRAFAAWRTIATASGDILMLHQVTNGSLHAQQFLGGYGSLCVPGIATAITTFSSNPRIVAVGDAVLAQDIAVMSPNLVIVPALGNAHTHELPSFLVVAPQTGRGSQNCNKLPPLPAPYVAGAAQYTSVAMSAGNALLFSRQPARLVVVNAQQVPIVTLDLSSVDREDTGHAIFHSNAGAGIACASCHLEGGDDGQLWRIDQKLRRTPSLLGTIAGTAPYHWEGDQANISALLDDVYSVRMNGGPLAPDQKSALERWVGALPPPPTIAVDAALAAQGKALFEG